MDVNFMDPPERGGNPCDEFGIEGLIVAMRSVMWVDCLFVVSRITSEQLSYNNDRVCLVHLRLLCIKGFTIAVQIILVIFYHSVNHS